MWDDVHGDELNLNQSRIAQNKNEKLINQNQINLAQKARVNLQQNLKQVPLREPQSNPIKTISSDISENLLGYKNQVQDINLNSPFNTYSIMSFATKALNSIDFSKLRPTLSAAENDQQEYQEEQALRMGK